MLITSAQSAISALEKAGIIPDVIDQFQESTILSVSYGEDKDVALGNELTIDDTRNMPNIAFITDDSPEAQAEKYALLMVDPDAPSRENPVAREWRHWIVGNIPGTVDLSRGTLVTPYAGPTPPRGSGFHRYVFLLYKQPQSEINYQQITTSRGGFKAREFAQQYGLQLSAVNYFRAKRD